MKNADLWIIQETKNEECLHLQTPYKVGSNTREISSTLNLYFQMLDSQLIIMLRAIFKSEPLWLPPQNWTIIYSPLI